MLKIRSNVKTNNLLQVFGFAEKGNHVANTTQGLHNYTNNR